MQMNDVDLDAVQLLIYTKNPRDCREIKNTTHCPNNVHWGLNEEQQDTNKQAILFIFCIIINFWLQIEPITSFYPFHSISFSAVLVISNPFIPPFHALQHTQVLQHCPHTKSQWACLFFTFVMSCFAFPIVCTWCLFLHIVFFSVVLCCTPRQEVKHEKAHEERLKLNYSPKHDSKQEHLPLGLDSIAFSQQAGYQRFVLLWFVVLLSPALS